MNDDDDDDVVVAGFLLHGNCSAVALAGRHSISVHPMNNCSSRNMRTWHDGVDGGVPSRLLYSDGDDDGVPHAS